MNKFLSSIRAMEMPVRVVKRGHQNPWLMVILYVCAVAIALLIGIIMMLSKGVDIGLFFEKVFTLDTIGVRYPLKSVENFFKLFVPLLITSLALALAFKMRFWNIGGEGQFIIGAITASAIALGIDTDVSPYIMVLFMALGGGIAAGIYGVFTAILKVKFGTNETLLTLMLNYVALYLIKFFNEAQYPEWNIFLNFSLNSRPMPQVFPEGAWMPTINIGGFNLNVSIIIALVFAVVMFVYLNKTKHGYEINVVGDSPNTARYAGMRVGKIIIRTMFISAFMIGVAGAFKVSTAHTMSSSVTDDVGWTGIVVAWVSKLNPFAIVLVSFLITMLQYGCMTVGAASAGSVVDANFADLLQGVILFIVLASDFIINYKVVFNIGKRKKKGDGGNVIKEDDDAADDVVATDEASIKEGMM